MDTIQYPCTTCASAYPDKETCGSYQKCAAYNKWFNSEWKEIREAAEKIKNEKKK